MTSAQLLDHDLPCLLCKGDGDRIVIKRLGPAGIITQENCHACDGTGRIPRPLGWRPHEQHKPDELPDAATAKEPGELSKEFVDSMMEES